MLMLSDLAVERGRAGAGSSLWTPGEKNANLHLHPAKCIGPGGSGLHLRKSLWRFLLAHDGTRRWKSLGSGRSKASFHCVSSLVAQNDYFNLE